MNCLHHFSSLKLTLYTVDLREIERFRHDVTCVHETNRANEGIISSPLFHSISSAVIWLFCYYYYYYYYLRTM